jgi:hypothetical protein
MVYTFGKDVNDRQPLRRYLVAIIPYFLDDGFKSFSMVCQLKPLFLNNNHFQLTLILFSVNA